MTATAPSIAWHAFGSPPPGGKTGSLYRFEPAAEPLCVTCAAPIEEGVPFAPRRKVAGIDNTTFHGHAEFARWGTHACPACAWLYGDPKRSHRGMLALGDQGWWPTIAKPLAGRPRWRSCFAAIGRADQETPMTGVLTTDPKVRLWPRMKPATAGAPGLYVHSPDHDWSRPTTFDLAETGRALALVDAALAIGATKTLVWTGLAGSTALAAKAGLPDLLRLDAALDERRGSAELLIALLVA